MAATERIPVQVTKAEKAKIAKKAKAAAMTMGELLRRAADAYEPLSAEEEKVLNLLAKQIRESVERANRAMDHAIAVCAESNERIAKMEADHAARKQAAEAST